MSLAPHLVLVARMLGGHGIQGFVKLKVFLENPQDLLSLTPLATQDPEKSFSVLKILERPKVILGRFKDVSTRTQADALKGTNLYGDPSLFSPPEKDSYFTKDLIGLPILEKKGGDVLGVVAEVLFQKSGDILSIKTTKGLKEVLLPFRKEFFPEVVVGTPTTPGYLLIDQAYLHELEG